MIFKPLWQTVTLNAWNERYGYYIFYNTHCITSFQPACPGTHSKLSKPAFPQLLFLYVG